MSSLIKRALTGEGWVSFWGERYTNLLTDITGVELDGMILGPLVLERMAGQVDDHLKRHYSRSEDDTHIEGYHHVTVGELRELADLFKVCGERDHYLNGWW